MRRVLVLMLLCAACREAKWPVFPAPPEAQLGRWADSRPTPIVQLHLVLLPNGKILTWGHKGVPQVWDPATGQYTAVPSPVLVFCAGHDFLPDGRLLVAGGHITDLHGLPSTNIFDPATNTWTAMPDMAAGRWYPTNTTLPDGEVVTIGGTDTAGNDVPIPEVWNGSSWRQLTTAALNLPLYPRDFVAPDGRIFVAGEAQQTYFLDVTGTGRWTPGPMRQYGSRDYGSAVMYEPGKIIYIGGGDPPTNTAEIIDLNKPDPQWRYTRSMTFPRRQMDATLLPTGDVLVTGGTTSGGFSDPTGGVHSAEIWHPKSETWDLLASNAVTRVYHGTTLLLPDGRLLHTGSGDAAGQVDQLNYEMYSPPYFFRQGRPSITGTVPGVINYGQTLVIGSPEAAGIENVTLLRFAAVTHAFDQSQRLVPLTFAAGDGTLSLSLPTSRTVAPPGPYMLFVVNKLGVPSEGRVVLLQ